MTIDHLYVLNGGDGTIDFTKPIYLRRTKASWFHGEILRGHRNSQETRMVLEAGQGRARKKFQQRFRRLAGCADIALMEEGSEKIMICLSGALRKICVAMAFSIPFCGQADADPPPQFIAAYIDGIGFPFVPAHLSNKCEKDLCEISQQTDRVKFTLRYPSNLVYFGAGCPPNAEAKSLKFRATDVPVSFTGNSVHLRLESLSCSGRVIDLIFVTNDWRDPDWIRSDIIQASRSWFVCLRGAHASVQCDDAAAVNDESTAIFYKAINPWIAARSQRIRSRP